MPHLHSYVLLVEIELGTEDEPLPQAAETLNEIVAAELAPVLLKVPNWRRVRCINVGDLATCHEMQTQPAEAAPHVMAACLHWISRESDAPYLPGFIQ